MSGTPALQLPAFLLREEDLVTEFDPVAVAVVQAGSGDGTRVLEAFIRCCFKPEAVDRTLRFYLDELPVMGPTFFREADLIKTILRGLMRKALILDAGAAVRAAVRDGMLTVKGLPPGQFKSVQLDTDLVMKGELDAVEETITDYRTDQLIGSVRLVPTRQARKMLAAKFDRAKAFTAALDKLNCYRLGEKVRHGHRERVITVTKQQLFRHLNEAYKGQFGTPGTFARKYTCNGEWAEQLDFPVSWASDSHRDRD